jgi:hypothetical protein
VGDDPDLDLDLDNTIVRPTSFGGLSTVFPVLMLVGLPLTTEAVAGRAD